MNKLIVTAFLSLAFVACGGGREPQNPLAKAQPGDTQQVLDAKKMAKKGVDPATVTPEVVGTILSTSFDPAKTYVGESLTLVIPHANNFGWINIQGEGAQKMYETMKVKAVDSGKQTATLLSSKLKQGLDIACYAQAHVATPKTLDYACSIYIDYRTGSVTAVAETVDQDLTVADLAENFSNPQVTLAASISETKLGQITLSGLDAQALYTAMATESHTRKVDELMTTQKQGKSLSCSKSSAEVIGAGNFTCSLTFNYSVGEVASVASATQR